MINHMRRAVMPDTLAPLSAGIQVNDPNDAFLLTMAQTGEADFLVTGDHRAGLLQQCRFGHTHIVTPTIFCAEALRPRVIS